MKKVSKSLIVFNVILSIIFFYIANRATGIYIRQQGTFLDNLNAIYSLILSEILQRPFLISLKKIPILIGIAVITSYSIHYTKLYDFCFY